MAITATVTVKDKDGNTVYSKGSIAISSVSANFVDANNYPLQLPLSGDHTVQVDLAGGNYTSDQNVGVVLLTES